ncbi:MAG TPA: 30S ribosome-binding factor RbfA [Vicinamibacterales bacterium]
MSANRPDRVAEAIRIELSELLAREVHDPGIGFITLTRVSMTPDLQLARVHYTSLGDEKAQRDTARALERAAPFLRRQLGGRIRLRRVPELTFHYDRSIAHTDRVEQILRDLKTEAQSRSEGATGPEEQSGAGTPESAGGSDGSKPPGKE